MIRGMRAERVFISVRRDSIDLESLFREGATIEVLRFIGIIEVGRLITKEGNRDDY
jgi:hypothetical protein